MSMVCSEECKSHVLGKSFKVKSCLAFLSKSWISCYPVLFAKGTDSPPPPKKSTSGLHGPSEVVVEGVNHSGYAHLVENFIIIITTLILTFMEIDTSPDRHSNILLNI